MKLTYFLKFIITTKVAVKCRVNHSPAIIEIFEKLNKKL